MTLGKTLIIAVLAGAVASALFGGIFGWIVPFIVSFVLYEPKENRECLKLMTYWRNLRKSTW